MEQPFANGGVEGSEAHIHQGFGVFAVGEALAEL